MTKRTCFFFLPLLLAAVVPLMSQSIHDINAALPAEISGWKTAGTAVPYQPDTLYKYINGGAELFISYNFRQLLAQKYTKDGESEITVDVFDMGDSYNAYGVFANSCETSGTEVGQGCEYSSGLLNFWQDRYYVSILAYPETPAKRELVFQLADRLSKAIAVRGPLPPLLARLPQTGLIPDSTRYFHHYIWLNSQFFISNQNILGIDDTVQAVLAKYRHPSGAFFLLLLQYPDEAAAAAAAAAWSKQFQGGKSEEITARGDGRFSGCRRSGGLLALVLNAPDAAAAGTLLEQITRQ